MNWETCLCRALDQIRGMRIMKKKKRETAHDINICSSASYCQIFAVERKTEGVDGVAGQKM